MVRTVAQKWFQRFSAADKKFIQNIKKFGFSTTNVVNDEGLSFCYSTGFWENLSHPEIIVFGLENEVAHDLIWVCYNRISEGLSFANLEQSDQILNDYECVFKLVSPLNLKEHLCFADWYYCREQFEALQLHWPDKEGRFSWEEGVDEYFKLDQPDLSK